MSENKDFALALIKNSQEQFKQAMPDFFRKNATQFFMAVYHEFKKVPKLQKCEPETLIGAIASASHLGLMFGVAGHVYMIPYDKKKKVDGKWIVEKTECQLLIGYKGYLNLYMRNKEIMDVYAELVYEGDDFTIRQGTNPSIEHTPKFKPIRRVIGGYGVAKFKNGSIRIIYLTYDDLMKIKAASKASDNGPWKDWPEEMMKKSIIKKMKNSIDWEPLQSNLFEFDGTIGSTKNLSDRQTIDVNHEEVKKHNEEVKNRATVDMMAGAKVTESKNA